uniref:Major facilitator superfamily associated domain-containing protein n=1 Tax=Homalodisca liturata TaxID=320908 RepID=A0A1B6IY33_9HEMI
MKLLLCFTLGAVWSVSRGAPAPATTEEVWVNPLEGVLDTTTEADLEGPPPTLVSAEQYESREGDTMADTPPIRNYNPWATSTLRRYWFALGLGSFLYSLYHLTYNYLVSVLVPPPPPAAGAQTYTLHWSFFE